MENVALEPLTQLASHENIAISVLASCLVASIVMNGVQYVSSRKSDAASRDIQIKTIEALGELRAVFVELRTVLSERLR